MFFFPFSAVIPNFDFSGIVVPSASSSSSNGQSSNSLSDDPATVRQLLLDNPKEIALLQQNNPRLADALLNGSPGIKVSHRKINLVETSYISLPIFLSSLIKYY